MFAKKGGVALRRRRGALVLSLAALGLAVLVSRPSSAAPLDPSFVDYFRALFGIEPTGEYFTLTPEVVRDFLSHPPPGAVPRPKLAQRAFEFASRPIGPWGKYPWLMVRLSDTAPGAQAVFDGNDYAASIRVWTRGSALQKYGDWVHELTHAEAMVANVTQGSRRGIHRAVASNLYSYPEEWIATMRGLRAEGYGKWRARAVTWWRLMHYQKLRATKGMTYREARAFLAAQRGGDAGPRFSGPRIPLVATAAEETSGGTRLLNRLNIAALGLEIYSQWYRWAYPGEIERAADAIGVRPLSDLLGITIPDLPIPEPKTVEINGSRWAGFDHPMVQPGSMYIPPSSNGLRRSLDVEPSALVKSIVEGARLGKRNDARARDLGIPARAQPGNPHYVPY